MPFGATWKEPQRKELHWRKLKNSARSATCARRLRRLGAAPDESRLRVPSAHHDLANLLRRRRNLSRNRPPSTARWVLLEQGFYVHKVESASGLCGLPPVRPKPTHSSAMFICSRCGVVRKSVPRAWEGIMHTLAAKMGCATTRRYWGVRNYRGALRAAKWSDVPSGRLWSRSLGAGEEKPR